MLKIKKEIIDGLIEHAKKDAPIEACGYLGGREGVVETQYPLTNTDESREHFSFAPREQFDTVRKARDAGLILYANYHSHPETPARPSGEDIKLAYDPGISYVIVSLAGDEPEIKSFKIADGAVTPEEVEVV